MTALTPMLPPPDANKTRRPYRAPLGMPKGRDDWRVSSVVSVLVHLAIILLLVMPFAMMGEITEMEQGAGGPGPAGGGGGGNRGTGRLRTEALRFVRIAPTPPPTPKPAAILPPLTPPVVPPTPQPPQAEPVKEPEAIMPVGVGGGSGTDQTAGSGPGSGGGVGTGIGTGRGSGTGAGTGGGTQENHPPTPIEMFIPPLPTPASVRGFRLIAEFDVDESGKVLTVNFNETRDRGYNKRLREVLRGYRFRAGTRADGTPVRMKAQVAIDLP